MQLLERRESLQLLMLPESRGGEAVAVMVRLNDCAFRKPLRSNLQ